MLLNKRSEVDFILPALDDTNWNAFMNKENISTQRQKCCLALLLLPVNIRFFFQQVSGIFPFFLYKLFA